MSQVDFLKLLEALPALASKDIQDLTCMESKLTVNLELFPNQAFSESVLFLDDRISQLPETLVNIYSWACQLALIIGSIYCNYTNCLAITQIKNVLIRMPFGWRLPVLVCHKTQHSPLIRTGLIQWHNYVTCLTVLSVWCWGPWLVWDVNNLFHQWLFFFLTEVLAFLGLPL